MIHLTTDNKETPVFSEYGHRERTPAYLAGIPRKPTHERLTPPGLAVLDLFAQPHGKAHAVTACANLRQRRANAEHPSATRQFLIAVALRCVLDEVADGATRPTDI